MSAAEAAHRPGGRGRAVKLWLAFLALIAAGVGLAWAGTVPLKGETTPNGVRIRPLEKGTGPFIQPVDGVVLDYEGRLANGTVFDDSARHGGPQPMLAGQVIPGFAEALTKMQKGGRYKIHIPGAQAYGPNPPQGSPFGPNADLDFDIHIVQIVPNAALMQQQQQGQAEAVPGEAPAEQQLPTGQQP